MPQTKAGETGHEVVDIGFSPDVAVDTSTLAKESGGNLADIKTDADAIKNDLERPFSGGTPRAPTSITDNLVHEITNSAGAGMQVGKHYVVTQVGGADVQVYFAATIPSVATARQSPFHLATMIPWEFSPASAGLHLWAVKAVDSTGDATCYCTSSDGGTGY